MSRDYGSRRSSRSRRGAPHPFLLSTVIFSLGYLTASFFDAGMIMRWVNTKLPSQHESQKAPVASLAQQAVVSAKPKFEFYTLLANEKVPGSQANTSTAPAQKSSVLVSAPVSTTRVVSNAAARASSSAEHTPPVNKGVVEVKPAAVKSDYLVQVASFKARQDAEQMKGTLILKGFNVFIVPVVHASKGNWFRVVVGPYPNRVLAQKAQVILARNEHINGMVTSAG